MRTMYLCVAIIEGAGIRTHVMAKQYPTALLCLLFMVYFVYSYEKEVAEDHAKSHKKSANV